MSSKHTETHMTVAQLIERGWNLRLIKKYLGNADLDAWLGKGRSTRLYKISKILLTENSNDAFKMELQALKQRCLQPTQRSYIEQKKQRVLDLAIETPMPVLSDPFAEVLKQAWLSETDVKGSAERVALEFLLLTMETLGRPLMIFSGYPGVREAREVLRNRYLRHIRDHYPMLSEEVDVFMSNQREAKT